MKIVIPGGSGQVGTMLARAFVADGHEVVVLSRKVRPAPWRVAEWDGVTDGDWWAEIDGAHAVINLAGRSVNCRYHAANRREIKDSRIKSTLAVGRAIAKSRWPPSAWLQASTATIYAHPDLEGPVNLAAPHPIPNEEFMRTLRAAWGIRFGLRANKWMLELGTALIRSESELVLKSRRVVPSRLLESGFAFEFPTWHSAAADLCARWRQQRVGAASRAAPEAAPSVNAAFGPTWLAGGLP